MHVYHYNHTERTSLVRLAADYGVAELELERLIATGLFVDLFPIVTGAMQVGVESYGLKHIERLTDYERSHDIDRGAGAVVEYEHWMNDGDQARLDRIARYNEDDVRATMAVRDWLVDHRPDDVDWRDAGLEPQIDDEELDARIEALHAFGPGTDEHLMGDLLGYWRRERRVVAADCLRLSMADEHDQFESLGAIARLEFQGFEDRGSPTRRQRAQVAGRRLLVPAAAARPRHRAEGSKMIVALTEQQWAFFTLGRHRSATPATFEVSWNQEMIDQGVIPTSLVHFANFPEGAKLTALCDLADQMLAGDATAVGHAILRNDPPRFLPGQGPADGRFVGGYEAICDWAPHLDGSFVPIQGPPGTGKTFTGAHVIHTLVKQGKRVGVTAMSHHAIDNLMEAVVDRFAEEGDELRAVRKAGQARRLGRRRRLHRQQPDVRHRRLRRDRRHVVAVRQPGDARQPGRRAGRRRGRPARPGRHAGGVDLGDERDPARRPAAAAAGGQGEPPEPVGCERARAPARSRTTAPSPPIVACCSTSRGGCTPTCAGSSPT